MVHYVERDYVTPLMRYRLECPAGRHNEYQQKSGDALRLGSRDHWRRSRGAKGAQAPSQEVVALCTLGPQL